jgi:hypothetical protein
MILGGRVGIDIIRWVVKGGFYYIFGLSLR